MISAVKETPRAARIHDVAAKLQSFGKSRVQHLYPGIIKNSVAPDAASRWQEAREREDQARNRGHPCSQSFRVAAELCERHVVSQWLPIMVRQAIAVPTSLLALEKYHDVWDT